MTSGTTTRMLPVSLLAVVLAATSAPASSIAVDLQPTESAKAFGPLLAAVQPASHTTARHERATGWPAGDASDGGARLRDGLTPGSDFPGPRVADASASTTRSPVETAEQAGARPEPATVVVLAMTAFTLLRRGR